MTNGVIYCNRCGAQNSGLARFCATCGTPFALDSSAPPPTAPEVVPQAQGPAAPPMPTQYVAAPAVRYGGFWIRFVAVIIDALIMGIVVWPVAGILGLMVGVAGGSVQMPDVGIHLVRGVVAGALFLFAGWIYEASLESSSKQATVGKMALGLKVTDEQGRRISFGRATARYFSKILSRMTLMIGYIMAGFTARKQALHDLIAGTLVVRSL
ncbi:MAG TPA: RDD family protein [Terriglobales bacterium]